MGGWPTQGWMPPHFGATSSEATLRAARSLESSSHGISAYANSMDLGTRPCSDSFKHRSYISFSVSTTTLCSASAKRRKYMSARIFVNFPVPNFFPDVVAPLVEIVHTTRPSSLTALNLYPPPDVRVTSFWEKVWLYLRDIHSCRTHSSTSRCTRVSATYSSMPPNYIATTIRAEALIRSPHGAWPI